MFAFVVLSTGLFSSERGKETVYAGLAKTRGSMELTGGVIATSDTTQLTDLTFDVTLAAGGDSVNLNPADTTNRTVISYNDGDDQRSTTLVYTTTVITGDDDKLLEPGELLEISIDLTADGSTTACRSARTRRSRSKSSRRRARTWSSSARPRPRSTRAIINLN